jgi:hypothetical protein
MFLSRCPGASLALGAGASTKEGEDTWVSDKSFPDTFGTVKGRFGPLLALWAIYFGITIGLVVVLGIGLGVTGVAGLATMSEGDLLGAGIGIVLIGLLFYVGYLIVAMAQYASLMLAASPLKQVTVGEAFGAGWRAAPALLLLMIVLIIGYIAAGLVLGPLGEVFDALGAWGASLFALLTIPVVIWLGCRLSLLFTVVAVDGARNPFAAIARSWRLTRGHALTIFLVSLVFIVILCLIGAVALLPSIGLLRTLADPAALTGAAAMPAVGGLLLFGLGILVLSVLFNLCQCAFLAVIHGSLSGAAGEGAAETFA